MSKSQERKNWNDPRSVLFRAAVKGWSFEDAATIAKRYVRAKEHAWLPEHFETLANMARHANFKEPV